MRALSVIPITEQSLITGRDRGGQVKLYPTKKRGGKKF